MCRDIINLDYVHLISRKISTRDALREIMYVDDLEAYVSFLVKLLKTVHSRANTGVVYFSFRCPRQVTHLPLVGDLLLPLVDLSEWQQCRLQVCENNWIRGIASVDYAQRCTHTKCYGNYDKTLLARYIWRSINPCSGFFLLLYL